ncbi:MAG: hypothetical protein M3P13_06785 [Acidobacteriota bacterium]|nr:hypothetical protein [Acidobacteriota bacterium]
MRKIVYVAGAVVVVGLLALSCAGGASSDEAPIIVKNGSIEIETVDGQWRDGDDAWVNETAGKHNDKELWVKVTSSTGTCRGVGQPIRVQYSKSNDRAVFTTGGSFLAPHRTRVGPQTIITYVDSKHLRAGTPGDAGHINAVQARSATCTIAAESSNVEISICSSQTAKACQ